MRHKKEIKFKLNHQKSIEMKKLSIICMTILAVFAMASCRGPQGPVGPAGQDGNDANVASSTVIVESGDWEWVRFFTDGDGNERGQYMVTLNYPAINNNVFNYGAVLVYMKVEGTWSQVPLTYYYYEDNNGEVSFYEASIETATLNDGGVRLFWTESDMWKVCPDTHVFKIVAIEAATYSSRSDVDYSDYNAVKTAFQLAD